MIAQPKIYRQQNDASRNPKIMPAPIRAPRASRQVLGEAARARAKTEGDAAGSPRRRAESAQEVPWEGEAEETGGGGADDISDRKIC